MVLLRQAGFTEARLLPDRSHPFAPAGAASAAEFGAHGIVLVARKPAAASVIEHTDLPVPDTVLEGWGDACATLTPRIATSLKSLRSGQVLEVRTDDPAAREGVAAWCRLTGHTLLLSHEEDEQRTRFWLRRR